MAWSWVRQWRRAHTTRRHPFMLSQHLRLLPVIGLGAVLIGMIGKALGFVRAFGYANSLRAGRCSCMKYAAILEWDAPGSSTKRPLAEDHPG